MNRQGSTVRQPNAQQAAIVARRKVVRAAFDAIRNDQKRKGLVRELAGALGGSITLSEKLYAEAENLCFLSGQHELVEAANLAASAARLEKKYRAQKQHRRQMARINQ